MQADLESGNIMARMTAMLNRNLAAHHCGAKMTAMPNAKNPRLFGGVKI